MFTASYRTRVRGFGFLRDVCGWLGLSAGLFGMPLVLSGLPFLGFAGFEGDFGEGEREMAMFLKGLGGGGGRGEERRI